MKIFLLGLLYSISQSILAHPVIFKEGTVVSSSNMPSVSDNQILYTFDPKWATGVNHWRFSKNDKNTEMGLARLNHLLWRNNGANSQANIYLLSGFGVVDSEIEKRDTREIYMGGFEADWETRTLFTALKYYHFTSPAIMDLSMAQVRVGFSPFIAGFEELQSWFMIQAMIMPDIESSVAISPMFRFFYKNILWEMGSSTRGDWMLNLMLHY
jgi:hypothetical protein